MQNKRLTKDENGMKIVQWSAQDESGDRKVKKQTQ